MNQKGQEQKFVDIAKVGNFTKNAVQDFEEKVVDQKDFLAEVKASEVEHMIMTEKFH
jgi:hypothetical protein